MLKARGSLFLLLFLFSTLLFQFCKKEDSGTFKTFIHKVLFADINTTSTGGYYNIYNENDTLNVELNDTNGFIIVTEDTTVRISYHNSNGNLFARSPVLPPTIDQDSLIIFTLNDFDAMHPAGSDVSDCFVVSHVYSSAFTFLPLEQFNEIGKNSYSQDFKLHLIKHPSSNQLKLKLYFYDKVYTDGILLQSPTILFKP